MCQYLFDDMEIEGTRTMRYRDIGSWVIVIAAIVRVENPCDVWPGVAGGRQLDCYQICYGHGQSPRPRDQL